MNFINKHKYLICIIVLGLSISIIRSVVDTNKHDKFRLDNAGNQAHSIIRTDVAQYWNDAHLFKRDIENGISFFKSGKDYDNAYLYAKFIAFYYIIIGNEIKDESGNYKLDNYKYGIPIIQCLIYYSLLIWLIRKLNTNFSNKINFVIISFLALEPTINQYNSSYWTESLYFSSLLALMGLLIKPNISFTNNLVIGLLIGLSILQRNVSIYLIIPITIYFIICFRKESLFPILYCLIGYLMVIFFLGYTNFLRSGNFYIIPWDQHDAPYYLISHKLNKETNEAKYNKRSEWINENKLDPSNENDRLKIAEYQTNYFKDSLKNNFFRFIQLHIWKSIQSSILDPFNINSEYYNDKTIKNYWERWNYQYKYKIPYSLLFYLVCLIGFCKMIRQKEFKIIFLVLIICCYYTAILGWVGTSRYLVPNLIFLSIFFGFGIDYLIKILKKYD